MYFGARWSVSNNLTAYNTDSRIEDILYLDARGTGRVVGAAAFLNNPATAPTSWGNWWGEGDEKIFVDGDTFPSFFGTGSEDYFNYSWSSPRIFAYPYCGQPRNDGPDNRGFVTNYRWHITDDIPFSERVRFYMELRHHDRVAGLDYARMVWYYALPGATTGYRILAPEELLPVRYRPWMPVGYLGSAGNEFVQAEEMAKPAENLKVIDGEMFAGGKALGWKPAGTTDQMLLTLPFAGTDKSRIGFTLEHGPDGGTIRCLVNGNPMKIDNQESITLMMPHRTVLRNHFTGPVDWRKGENRIVFEMTDADGSRTLNIDFIWIKTR
jgi:hypothetical protein